MKKSTTLERLPVGDVVHKQASHHGKAAKEPTGDWGMLLRKRISERLAEGGITEPIKQAAALCSITGRAYQTTRRWVDEESSGLPDLTSFRLICEGLDCDANWLIGLSRSKRSLRNAQLEAQPLPVPDMAPEYKWMLELLRQVYSEMGACQPRRMTGDEMEPLIHDGDMMFVDRSRPGFNGNGVYLVEYQGAEVVRSIEMRVGEGCVVKCFNGKYKDKLVRKREGVGLKILARVEGALNIRKFWRVTP
ncbi:S24 family peptidase [Aquabacterium sp.]|uniref:S24 family peptidase n=1 Tax=Aquabacterium sp. TaxID=1872578 RepID=UPI004037BF4B